MGLFLLVIFIAILPSLVGIMLGIALMIEGIRGVKIKEATDADVA